MKKLLYLNNLTESKCDMILDCLKSELSDWHLESPSLPKDSYDILEFLQRFCLEYQPDVILGCNDASFFVHQLGGYHRVIVNPTSTLAQYVDEADFDSNGTYGIPLTSSQFKRHLEMENNLFEDIKHPDYSDTGTCWCIFNSHVYGKTKDFKEFVRYYYPNVITFKDYEEIGLSTVERIIVPQIRAIVEMNTIVGNFTKRENRSQRIARSYRERLQYKDFSVPMGVERLDAMFQGNTSIKSIILPSSILQLSEGEFMGCKNLESIEFPEGMTEIPDNCCKDCVNLTEVILPSSIRKIGKQAFANTMITKIAMPKRIHQIASDAFASTIVETTITINSKSLPHLAITHD